MRFRLCEEDRKRFGVAEWLTFDLRAISVADLEELSERCGFDPTDWPEPWLGQLTLEQAGDPDARPKPPRWHDRASAWMLLRQNGCAASWDDAGTVRMFLVDFRGDEIAPASPGKGDTQETPSPDSEASTTTPSSTSGLESPHENA
jgi:hypothetical protein